MLVLGICSIFTLAWAVIYCFVSLFLFTCQVAPGYSKVTLQTATDLQSWRRLSVNCLAQEQQEANLPACSHYFVSAECQAEKL